MTFKPANQLVIDNSPPKRQFELDALRGMAALYVVFFHYFNMAGFKSAFINAGVTGVDLFFLISGYVIFMTLEKTRVAKDFLISRLSRLFPSFIIMMAITLVTIYVFQSSDFPGLKTILLNLTMMPEIFKVPLIDESYWTLAVEMQFYFFMLLIFLFNKLPQVELIGGLLLACIFAFFFTYTNINPDASLYIIVRSYFPLINHFSLFFAGIVFYKLRQEGFHWYRYLGVLVCFLINLFLFDKAGKAHFFIGIELYTLMMFIHFSLFFLFVNGKLRFLNVQLFVFLGAISYSLYLIHQRTGSLLFHYFNDKVNSPILIITALTGLMILLSAFVTYKVEKPIIAFIRSYFLRPKKKSTQEADLGAA